MELGSRYLAINLIL